MSLTYRQALEYVLSLTDLEKRTDLTGVRAALGLERMGALLTSLGHPETMYATLHIAGTKGKGSTAAMLASILQAAGYRVGLYTSPHLHTFRERIQVNGRPIGPGDFARAVAHIRPLVEGMADRPTTFEAATAVAFLHFAQQGVQVAVLETGMGGRLDATNVVMPLVSIITSISFDHMAILGSTLAEIAREKAGIIKPRVPVVTAPQPADALAVIEGTAWERGSPITVVGRDVHWQRIAEGWRGQKILVHLPLCTVGPLRLRLLGAHQAVNATLAVTAADVARQNGLILVDDRAVALGLRAAYWPGRLERLARHPLLVVDGAHNVDSANRLGAALGELRRGRRWVFILGVSADKDSAGFVTALAPLAQAAVVTQAHHPRAAPPERLLADCIAAGIPAHPAADVPEAVERARHLAGPEGAICATGSLFLVAEVRALIKGLRQEM